MTSTRFFSRLAGLCLLVFAVPAVVGAQTAAKKPLDHDVYDIWESVGSQTLSADGGWLAFVVSPSEGDGTLTLHSLQGGGADREGTVARGSSPSITPDSRFLVFTIDPMTSVVDSLEAEGERGDALPKDSLGIIRLSSAFTSGGALDGDFFRVGRVASWQTPQDEGAYVAYLLEPEQEPDSAAAGDEPAQERPSRAAGRARGGRGGSGGSGAQSPEDREKDEGNPLVLRDMESGSETRFENVTAYAFTDDGTWLVYAASNEDGTADGVYAVRTATGERSPLLTGEGEYSSLTLADDGRQVAFLTNRDDWEAEEPAFTLFHARLGEGEARAVATEGTPGIPEGWWVSERGSLSFSGEGSRLFFGTAPRPPEEQEDTIPDDERVVVDIWNWKDPLIQPMQLVQADRERNRTYQAYASTSDFHVVQLATEEIPDVTVARDGEGDLAVGTATEKYGWYVSHDGTYGDIYLIDVATGEPSLVLEKQRNPRASFSPEGRYLSWWDGGEKAWMVMDVATQTTRNVSDDIPFPVYDELDDHPDDPPSHGSAGWLEGDQAFLVYDRFDVWSVDPAGQRAPVNLTEGVGRANDIALRYVDPERGGGGRGFRGGGGGAEGIDPSRDVLLSAFHQTTKQSGFYRDRFSGSRPPQRLIMDDYRFGNPQKAEDADVYVLTRESFAESRNVWVSDPAFRNLRKISDTNPQQAEYVWGTAELVDWVSNDGIPLQGILMKPEGFDASKQYPMMVYFYERSSDGLNQYRAPAPGSSSVNPTFYVSRGYVFFIPDIPYEIGHPGESAIDAVVPGILKVLGMGFVDKDRIGVQGHSWGGYQIAYMVTRTNIFAAAEAGAPVSNMTSAYGGIRWGTGMSREFQYERTQSRIGGSLWDQTLRYIENSPVFEADKIQTPLLMMHNDQDDAVPWYQGIEMFMALRRLQKPVWMFNYNGEPHGLRKPQNRKDWTIRLQQFFDHYLMGAPEPVWMADGVPAVMKGETLGLELVGDGGSGDGGR